MTTDELKPCPFCGGDDVKTFGPYGWYRQWGISHSCSSFYSGSQEMFQGFSTEENAVSAWNRRAALQPDADVAGVVARLRYRAKWQTAESPLKLMVEAALQGAIKDSDVAELLEQLGSLAFDCEETDGWKEAASTVDMAADLITRLSAELAEARAERDNFRRWGIIEVAIRNPNVKSYMNHWEDRATAAEAELVETKSLLAEARTEIAQMMHQGPEAECERLREALLKIEKEAHYGAYASDHIACHNCADLEKIARAALGEKADG